MPEALVSMKIMLVGTTDAAVRYFDNGLGRAWLAIARCLDDPAALRSLEDCKVNHGYGRSES